ncbi:MAG: mechanosensitive ion channel family protein [Nanoarchaeota archaeon]
MALETFYEFVVMNSVTDIIMATLYAVIVFVILFSFKRIIHFIFAKIFKGIDTKNIELKLDRTFDSIGILPNIILPLYIFYSMLEFPQAIAKFSEKILLAVVIYYAIKISQLIISFSIHKYIAKKEKKDKTFSPSALILAKKTIYVLLWLAGILLFISNLGFNLTTFIAGMGVSGIIIAFALQSVLSDLFASLSIHVDKPFQEGDFIIVGDELGVVKKIGLKSTKISHLNGELLTMPNKTLTESNIHNYGKMKRRRVAFSIGVTYDTTYNKLIKGKEILKQVLEDVENATPDRVHFKSYGDFNLNYEIVYYVETPDYVQYMNIQEKINLEIKKRFEKAKIEFAFPTQTIHIKK